MSKGTEKRIPRTTVKAISDYCFSIAEDSPGSSFEINHIKEVEDNILTLAKDRSLNSQLADIIALMHDLGRTKGGIVGKGHAREGAKIANEELRRFDLNENQIKIITRAIANHSSKKKIHDSYSELIKDADSMTRYSGFREHDDGTCEYQRSRFAARGKCRIEHNEQSNVPKIIRNLCADIETDLKGLQKGRVRGADIHRIRVRLRQVRSALWYIGNCTDEKSLSRLSKADDKLKEVFQDYGYARELYVLRKFAKSAGLPEKFIIYLNKRRDKAVKELTGKTIERHRQIIKETSGQIDKAFLTKKRYTFSPLQMNKKLINIIRSAEIKDFPSLHKLRILCKKLIYIHDMDLVELSQPDLIILLKRLHRDIGLMNDSMTNRKLIKSFSKRKNSVVSYEDMETAIESFYDYNGLSESASSGLFELNLRI